MFGKARAMESLIQNKASSTRPLRPTGVEREFPNGMFKAIADQRIEQPQKKEALTFYEALAQYTPKPRSESPSGQLGNRLAETLPDKPPEPTPPVDRAWQPVRSRAVADAAEPPK